MHCGWLGPLGWDRALLPELRMLPLGQGVGVIDTLKRELRARDFVRVYWGHGIDHCEYWDAVEECVVE